MPELPEVEYARTQVLAIKDDPISEFLIFDTRLLSENSSTTPNLTGSKLTQAKRWGKYVWLYFDNQSNPTLQFHLGMSGAFKVEPTPAHELRLPAETDQESQSRWVKHTRWALVGQHITVSCIDPRRFGKLTWQDGTEHDLGLSERNRIPDALEVRQSSQVPPLLAKSRQPIKVALMDQNLIGGVGNIYASEALFDARIDPTKPASSLVQKEWAQLTRSLNKVLISSIAHLTASTSVKYVNSGGENPFAIYGRSGDPCPRCPPKSRAKIISLTQSGRTTFFCRRCQK